ncbi:hypothetical protein B0H19DRAFT_1247985 [Mycena capillaripes]|nr:hypothetical protein B0H19DRAFT_1247985 [Mycena capillaripes]
MNMYLANLNLLHKLLSQEYFVQFCATSQHVSSLEQFDALADDCKDDSWSLTYNCKLQQEILFRIGIHLLPADNPQQAETTSTAGSSATFWCREDDSGGSALHCKTDEGYHALYLPGKTWKPEETATKIKEQIRAACLGVAAAVEQLQADSGQDKYVWHETTKVWNDEQGALFAARLQAASLNGLNLPSLCSKYMVQYKKLLIGKHYKALQQLGIFQLDPTLCSQEVFELWKANNVLGALIWFPVIKDMDQYLADLKVAINNVLDHWCQENPRPDPHSEPFRPLRSFRSLSRGTPDGTSHVTEPGTSADHSGHMSFFSLDPPRQSLSTSGLRGCPYNWAVVDPTRIMQKYKLHVLPHLPDAIHRFGPSILFATEIFECWNTVFRLCSVLSNHQAPSLDIATTLADMEHFKHQAGSEIRNFLTVNRQLQRRLAWASHDLIKPGTVKVLSKVKQQQPASWKTALGSSWNNEITQPINYSTETNWIGCKYGAAHSEDPCYPGSWVFFSDGSKVTASRIVKILVPEHTLEAAVVIQAFTVSNTTDPRYDMPVLIKTEKTIVAKPETSSIFYSSSILNMIAYISCVHLSIQWDRSKSNQNQG